MLGLFLFVLKTSTVMKNLIYRDTRFIKERRIVI